MKPVRVLQVIPALTADGILSVVMNWYRNIDKSTVHFDFITFNDGPMRQEIESLGGKIYLIKTFKQAPLEHLRAVNKIFNSEHSYDAIHVHNSFKNVVMLGLATKAGMAIRVCHSHTSGLEKKSLAPIFSILRFFTRKFSSVHLACGHDAGKFLFGSKTFTVLNNAIHVDRMITDFIPQDDVYIKYNIPKNKRLITLVARFSEVKNHQFLTTLARSNQLNNDIHFLCVGDGPLKGELINKIEQLKLSKSFTLLAANQDIPSILNISDGFIMPSLFEGVSISLLEAQAASLQCLVSDTIPTEVDMGLNKLNFLPLKQPEKWVEMLNKISKEVICDKRIKTHFDEKGYSIHSVINQLKSIYIQ